MQVQSYEHHRQIDPLGHLVAVPLAFINLAGCIVYMFARPSWQAVLAVITALTLLLTLQLVRGYATKLQDRIIRTEENLRHYLLTGKALDAKLSLSQIIGLRFASDEEFPELCQRALNENLTMDEIKKSVSAWRADLVRV